MRTRVALLSALLFLSMPGAAFADRSLTIGVGQFGVKAKDRARIADDEWYQIEYRWSPMHVLGIELVPSIGYARGQQGAYYIYHDLGKEFPFANERLYLRISSGPGYYRGEQLRDLGMKLEFRTGFELGFRTPGGITAGAAIYHLSNASLSSRNVGIEYATLNITVPF